MPLTAQLEKVVYGTASDRVSIGIGTEMVLEDVCAKVHSSLQANMEAWKVNGSCRNGRGLQVSSINVLRRSLVGLRAFSMSHQRMSGVGDIQRLIWVRIAARW